MKFLGIFPRERQTQVIHATEVHDALPLVELQGGRVDHGMVFSGGTPDEWPRFGIVVYEFGLFVPAAQQHWFSIFGRLYGGNALVYAVNEAGETKDFEPHYMRCGPIAVLDLSLTEDVNVEPNTDFSMAGHIRWHAHNEIEMEIAEGRLIRPEMRFNKELIWAWPQPAPADLQAAMDAHK